MPREAFPRRLQRTRARGCTCSPVHDPRHRNVTSERQRTRSRAAELHGGSTGGRPALFPPGALARSCVRERRERETPMNVIDAETIDALRSLQEEGDDDLLVELIDLFLQDAPDRIVAIRAAVATGTGRASPSARTASRQLRQPGRGADGRVVRAPGGDGPRCGPALRGGGRPGGLERQFALVEAAPAARARRRPLSSGGRDPPAGAGYSLRCGPRYRRRCGHESDHHERGRSAQLPSSHRAEEVERQVALFVERGADAVGAPCTPGDGSAAVGARAQAAERRTRRRPRRGGSASSRPASGAAAGCSSPCWRLATTACAAAPRSRRGR